MFKEDYVSFETAKLLKEKGFDESTSIVYTSYGDLCRLDRYGGNAAHVVPLSNEDSIRNSNYNDITKNYFEYTAPTLQMAMKWLREVHNFNVNIELTIHGYFCSLSHIVRDSLGYIIDIEDSEAWETAYYDSYEEACEAAIKYCLENLI